MYTCQCEGLQMGQHISAFQRCPLIEVLLYTHLRVLHGLVYLHVFVYTLMMLSVLVFLFYAVGDPKLDDENKLSSLPGKYLAPEKTMSRSQPGLKPARTIPSIATHQYMSGTSPVITPSVQLRENATPTGQK